MNEIEDTTLLYSEFSKLTVEEFFDRLLARVQELGASGAQVPTALFSLDEKFQLYVHMQFVPHPLVPGASAPSEVH